MSEIMQRLETLARNVETDWVKSRLAGTDEENDIGQWCRCVMCGQQRIDDVRL